MNRGALKQNATAVPRIRVGNSSGSHTGAQAQMPSVKKPKTPTRTSSGTKPQLAPQRYTRGVRTRHIVYHNIAVGLRPIASARKPRLTNPSVPHTLVMSPAQPAHAGPESPALAATPAT